MASGSFVTPYYTPPEGSTYTRRIKVSWSSTNNASNNTSTITWECRVDATSSNNNHFIMGGPIYVSINGSRVLSLSGQRKLSGNLLLGSGTTTVSHENNGKKTVSVSIEAAIYYNAVNNTYYGNITMTPNPVYTLTTTAGRGSTISVQRTSSPAGGTGAISAGSKKLYHGDVLKVTFGAKDYYVIAGRTVNGSTFTSGGSHTVSGNVTISSSATPNPPYTLSISAGTGTTITVNRTSSSIGGTGNLTAGKNLFPGDKLTITIAAKTHYKVVTRTVNGSTFTSGNSHTVSGNVSVVSTGAVNPIYALNISAGAGSSITVNRTSSPVGSTGVMTAGANKLFNGDVLQISFSPSANYKLLTTTVNGTNFTSGGSRTVTGDISVASTAQVLASSVGATAGTIGATSTVTVTRYATSYYHSLQYKFGNLTGYITSSGGTSSSEVKYQTTSIPFLLPTGFYGQIPNSKTGTCTITCRTYASSSSSTVLGSATTATFTVTATGSPTVSGSVVDTNATTIGLTGDNLKLVRYKSTAVAQIVAEAKNSATISKKTINDVSANSVTYNNVSTGSYVFYVADSRGYSSSTTITPQMIPYIQLSIAAEVWRTTPTGDEMSMKVSGNYFNGSFGANHNSLTLRYRYRTATSPTFGGWITIDPNNYSIGTSTYLSGTLQLADSFDYRQEYEFQIQAIDGTSEYHLTTETRNVTVVRGIPVFDWGENDFRFNVPVLIEEGATIRAGNQTTVWDESFGALLNGLGARLSSTESKIGAGLNVRDTRRDNKLPSWYYANRGKSFIMELKLKNTVGITSGVNNANYVIVFTIIPWSDSSAGTVFQWVFDSKIMRRRSSFTEDKWEAWETIA